MAKNSTELAKAYVQIIPSAEGLQGSLTEVLGGEADKAGKSAGARLSGALGTAAKVGIKAIGAATTAVGGFATTSVMAGQEFDSAMSQVAATMGFSTEELNQSGSAASETFKALSSFAKEMGATTAFSATESAEALNYMALAGYDADTSIKMLPNVLNLAAAGGMDLASASDMVTDAQTALGLSLDETTVMVDQMAKASSKSNTSVEKLGEAYLTVGGNAKGLAGGTQELSTVLGVLADNGIKGSEAGTHLRNIMLAMNPTTDKAAKAFEQLGLNAYNAEGELRPMNDIFLDLQKSLEGASDQEKTQIISDIFNKTDLASVNALLSTSKDRWDELGSAIADSKDAAQNMADTQLDNLAGDITLFKSALEGAKIAVSDGLTPTIRDFVQIGSSALGDITKALNAGDIEGAFGAIGDYLGQFINKIGEMLPKALELGVKLIENFLNAVMENLPMLIDAATQIILTLAQAFIDNLPMIIEAGIQIIGQLALGLAQALPELIPSIVEMVLTIVDTLVNNIDLLVDAAIAIVDGLAQGLIAALPTLIEKAPQIILKFAAAIVENLPKMYESGLKIVAELAKGLLKALPDLLSAGLQIITGLWEKLFELRDRFLEIGVNVVEGIKQGIANGWDSFVGWLDDKVGGLVNSVMGILGIHSPSKVFAKNVGQWIPAGIAEGVNKNLGVLDDAMDNINTELTKPNFELQTEIQRNVTISGAEVSTDTETNNDLLNLLTEYLPMIATNKDVNVTLQGDANALFKAVRDENRVWKNSTGRSAFA